jgi:SOS response regulatory protein OraA/RecX
MAGTSTADADLARWLARRPLSRAEAGERLAGAGHAARDVEGALDRAERQGWIDDAKLAYEFIVTRSARLGRGRHRLIAELDARGVSRVTGEAAWARAVELGEIDEDTAIKKALRKRIAAGGALDGRRYARVYNALLREGFGRDEVESALAPHRALLGGPDEGLTERIEE